MRPKTLQNIQASYRAVKALGIRWRADHATPRQRMRGAAALEYILVSTFAAVVTIGALGFIGKIVKEQLTNMGSRLGIADEPDLVDPFAGDGG